MRLSIYLALKNLFAHKKLFFLLVGILVFSFVNLTFFNAITNGVRYTTNQQLENYVFADLKILPNGDDVFLTDSDEIINKAEKLEEVFAVSQRLLVEGSISDGTNSFSVAIIGIEPQKESLVTKYANSVERGNYLSSKGTNSLIGDEIVGNLDGRKSTMDYEQLDLDVGDNLEISYTNGIKKEYKVEGIFDTLFWISDFKVFVPIDEIREVYNYSPELSSEILVKLNKGADKEVVKQKLTNFGINARIVDSAEELGLADTILESQKVTTVLANIVGIFSTFITVFIVVYINVNNSRRQLGVLKAIGIKEKSIVNSYIILSFFYSICGVILGIVTIYIISFYLMFNPINLPVGYFYPMVTLFDLFRASLIVIISSVISGYFASHKIIKTNIVEIIRGG